MVFFQKLLYLGICVRRFFNAGWNHSKSLSGGSSGGPRRSVNCSWRAPGTSRRRPRGTKNSFRRGKSTQERPTAILEPSWSQKGRLPGTGTPDLEGPGAAFGEALGGLAGTFLGDLVAHRFFIDVYRFRRFWDGFWYQKSKKNGEKTKLILKCFLRFLRWLCEVSFTMRFIKKWFSYCIL